MEQKEFLKDLEEAMELYPFLDYDFREGKEYPYKITDDFEVSDDEANHWGTFRASIYFNRTYPKGMPIMQDLSKDFPWEVDWHMSPDDGQCCVCGVIEHEEIAQNGISIIGFINDYLIRFYANQVYREKYGSYKNGEYAHNGEGVWEALEEEFKTKDREKIKNLLSMMRVKRGRNEDCFCGSGIKYKKCHLLRRNIIENVAKRISLTSRKDDL